jgi:hypothetical protein
VCAVYMRFESGLNPETQTSGGPRALSCNSCNALILATSGAEPLEMPAFLVSAALHEGVFGKGRRACNTHIGRGGKASNVLHKGVM